MRPYVRLGRLLELRYWKPLEHLDHFLVRNLIKVSIIKADCAEELVAGLGCRSNHAAA